MAGLAISTSDLATLAKLSTDGALLPEQDMAQEEGGTAPSLALGHMGLTGYEVVQDFIARHIQPLQARAHPAFDYEGASDAPRISSRALRADVVTQRVKDVTS
uniref:Uncharacterized protein n=1 Tax=Oryza sativa subsp. japonica TaxID=39947 RepID=Q6Z165_ORYSJ|nr:hypothetical protein [Oryza sativa Japonica Group]BAD31900.1 hypothetical protein [Oryza sativa Japonica Group]